MPVYNLDNLEDVAKYLLSLDSRAQAGKTSPRKKAYREWERKLSPESLKELKRHINRIRAIS